MSKLRTAGSGPVMQSRPRVQDPFGDLILGGRDLRRTRREGAGWASPGGEFR